MLASRLILTNLVFLSLDPLKLVGHVCTCRMGRVISSNKALSQAKAKHFSPLAGRNISCPQKGQYLGDFQPNYQHQSDPVLTPKVLRR